MHPSIIAQVTLQEGERLFSWWVWGAMLGPRAVWSKKSYTERNFDFELAHTLHCWRPWIARQSLSWSLC